MSETNKPLDFSGVLQQMAAMHAKKGADYGTSTDEYANVRSSERCGVPAWKNGILKCGDKMRRLETYCVRGHLENESVVDSLLDLAVYAVISLVLFNEAEAGRCPALSTMPAQGDELE